MARQGRPVVHNFTAGEWTPRLDGRQDLAKYYSACKILENMLAHPQGGATGRPGTRYAGDVKNHADAVRLIPFIFNETTAYILEVGPTYIRFWTNGARVESAGTPVEVTTPYGSATLPGLKYAQSNDVLFLVQADQQPYQLERYSSLVWKMRPINFRVQPSYEYGQRPDVTVTPSATTGVVTMTASAAFFEIADTNREIVIIGGPNIGARATITAYTSQTQVTAQISQDFVNTTANAAADWKLTGSPNASLTVDTKNPQAPVTLTLSAAGWRANGSDVGKIVKIGARTALITGFTSTTVMTGIIESELKEVGATPSGAWSLEEPSWSTANGFPRAIAFFEDRLMMGGSRAQPNTWWGSKTGDYLSFATGVDDDDALEYTLNSRQLNTIQWIEGGRVLLIGTEGEEYRITGASDGPITPSNVNAKSETTHGSSNVAPLRVGHVVLFLQRVERKLRELAYSFNEDSYQSPDLTLLAEHLTATGIIDMAYQQEPDSTVWAVRTDGTLLSMTYKRDQDVVSWARHVTRAGDAFEAVAVIPHPNGSRDQVWTVVRRTIGGVTKRYIEILDDQALLFDWPELKSDSALTYNSTPATVFSGLTHLIGATVTIVGDGAVYPSQVVSATGTVTISPSSSKVEVGLPFTSTVKPMRPAGIGLTKSWSDIVVLFKDTIGANVNGEQLPFRDSSMDMDKGVEIFNGEYPVNKLGWDTDASITVMQEQPLPITVLAITGTLNVE